MTPDIDSTVRGIAAHRVLQWAEALQIPRLVSVDLHGLAGALELSVVVHLGNPDDRGAVIAALPPDVVWGDPWEEPAEAPRWLTIPGTTGDSVPQTAAAYATAWGGVRVSLLSPTTVEEREAAAKGRETP